MRTTHLRLAKLTTQLRWRLSAGAGEAIYELGVLDDGSLIGITRNEMRQSLSTLATMLAGLGGGRIEISKVLVLGGNQDSDEESDGASDLDPYNAARGNPNIDAGFESFNVPPDLTEHRLAPPLVHKPVKPLVLPIPMPLHLPPNSAKHIRTPIERDEIKQQKRDARRLKRLSEGIVPVERVWNDKNPNYVAPVKLIKLSKSAPVKESSLHMKPRPVEAGSRARYIIEAVVMTSITMKRQEQETVVLDEDEENGLGFEFLDFASGCSL